MKYEVTVRGVCTTLLNICDEVLLCVCVFLKKTASTLFTES